MIVSSLDSDAAITFRSISVRSPRWNGQFELPAMTIANMTCYRVSCLSAMRAYSSVRSLICKSHILQVSPATRNVLL